MKRKIVLFVPGNQPQKVDGCRRFGADVIVLDLEDSVPSGPEKQHARAMMVDAARWDWPSPVVMRLNTAPEELAADLAFFQGRPPLPICVAKAEIDTMGSYGDADIRALIIETAQGVLDASQLIRRPGLDWVMPGAGDLAADLGAHGGRESLGISHARATVLISCTASGVVAVDAGSSNMRDLQAFRELAETARDAGFGGIMCNHPDQVRIASEAFLPTAEQIAWAEEIVRAWKDANDRGLGIAIVEGSIVDAMHVRKAEKILSAVRGPAMPAAAEWRDPGVA